MSTYLNNPVSEIMTSRLHTVAPSDTLLAVQDIFRHHNIHHIPVVAEHNKLVGIISRTDYTLFMLGRPETRDEQEINQLLLSSTLVHELMTTKIVKLEPADKIGTAAQILLENLFHAIPIVTDDGTLAGIVTTYDIIKYCLFKEYPNDDMVRERFEHHF